MYLKKLIWKNNDFKFQSKNWYLQPVSYTTGIWYLHLEFVSLIKKDVYLS